MPPISERRFSTFAHGKPEPIGIGLAHLQSSSSSRLLPWLARLQTGDQLSLRRLVLFLTHLACLVSCSCGLI